jgi:iron-sulfur cluster repair protein YtfE (RIC family)
MDIYTLLKQQHEEVSKLFEKCEETTDRAIKTRQNLFQQIRQKLEMHTRIEEELFYPRLEAADETRSLILEAYEEHGLVKQLLVELEGMEPDELWAAKLKVLKENVEHHVEEEQDELFPKAKKVLDAEEAEDICDLAEAMMKDMGQ